MSGMMTMAMIPNTNKLAMRIAPNTYRYFDENGWECVQFHTTLIYQRDNLGVIWLWAGKHETYTTKKRLNDLLIGTPFIIYQVNRIWFVGEIGNDDFRVPFKDGMWIDPDTCMVGGY
jgi:hypothetical protein